MPKNFSNLIVGVIFLLASFGVGCLVQYNIDKAQLKPVIKEKIVTKEKEVTKMIERPRIETWKFILHLRPNTDPKLAKVIGAAVDAASDKWNLPRKLLIAIMDNESGIDVNAQSAVGAKGLMQVLPKYHKDKIGDRNIWHIDVNVDVGAEVFRTYMDLEKGNVHKTFHRYLSKNATEVQLTKYTSGIYKSWSKLQMFDYLELGKVKEVSLQQMQTDTPLDELVSLTK